MPRRTGSHVEEQGSTQPKGSRPIATNELETLMKEAKTKVFDMTSRASDGLKTKRLKIEESSLKTSNQDRASFKDFTGSKLSELEKVGNSFVAAQTSIETLGVKDANYPEKLELLNPSELTRYVSQQEKALKKSLEGLLKA